MKELIDKFHMEINKNKVKNQQKHSFFFLHECHDIFKEGLSVFGWNDSLHIWIAELEVWEPLIVVNYQFFMSLILHYIIKYLLYSIFLGLY